MSYEIRKAERKRAFIKLGIAGPSGSGKSYSAIKLAEGLSGGHLEKAVIIDTENGSAELYSHLGSYSVITMSPPYGPRNYVEAIKTAHKAGFEIIIIDSASHEWDGDGGCLDIHTKLGGRYADWAKVTPQHKAFIDTILQTPAHFILTLRKKQDHAMTTENGKTKMTKVGLKEVQREGFEYELTISFDVEINHLATTSKDRTDIFMDRNPFLINADTGKELLAWANSAPLSPPVKPPPQDVKPPPETQQRNDDLGDFKDPSEDYGMPGGYVCLVGDIRTKNKMIKTIKLEDGNGLYNYFEKQEQVGGKPTTGLGQAFMINWKAYLNEHGH